MTNLLVIPTFDRPELLWLCLEKIAACPESQTLKIWVRADAHHQQMTPRKEIESVVAKFPHLAIDLQFLSPHAFHGNSFNLLTAYRDAYRTQARYVFMVEEDVLVRPQFFAWHHLQHEAMALGCSIGVEKRAHHGHFASLGVCFRREILSLILPHCRPEYFRDMRGYCRQAFPLSKVDCEQDGLWCRVLAGYPVSWASIPVCQHVGWYGYHRKKSIRPTGDLEDRYYQVTRILANAALLRVYVKEFHRDIDPLQVR